ncbi:MAG: SpoIIE family protein phosphatase [bacterium]
MNDKNLERFRRALKQNRDTLLEWLESDAPHKEVHLGGAQKSEVLLLVSELKEALGRVDSGEFGRCEICGKDVETKQLEYDFTSCVCLTHYSEPQLHALEKELELVSKVHKDLLPRSVPKLPGIQIAAYTESARIVGGDYYDFFNFRNNMHGLAIADVMDKGLPASMLMSNLQASLRILGPELNSPDDLTERLNRLFRHNLNLIRFISIFLAAIDLNSKTLKYCNAGHHPPLYWQRSSQSFNWLQPTGPALGLMRDSRYKTKSIRFDSGDLFVFYTDGLVEAGDQNGYEFGEERLTAFVKAHLQASPDELLQGLLTTTRNFTVKFQDDVTLMILKVG